MQRLHTLALAALLAVVAAGAAPQRASAFAHLWEITEIYSNADGSLQFIEFFTDAPAETQLTATFLRSEANDRNFDFSTNLTGSTQNRQLLVATAAFAAQPGAVAPDYVMPDSFIRAGGDTISFYSDGSYLFPPILLSDFSFGGATPLPLDGLHALARVHGSALIASALNSPTNFVGQAGSLLVPEPGSAALLAVGLAALALRARRGA